MTGVIWRWSRPASVETLRKFGPQLIPLSGRFDRGCRLRMWSTSPRPRIGASRCWVFVVPMGRSASAARARTKACGRREARRAAATGRRSCRSPVAVIFVKPSMAASYRMARALEYSSDFQVGRVGDFRSTSGPMDVSPRWDQPKHGNRTLVVQKFIHAMEDMNVALGTTRKPRKAVLRIATM